MPCGHLGRTGLEICTLSLGFGVTYQIQADQKSAVETLAAAFDPTEILNPGRLYPEL